MDGGGVGVGGGERVGRVGAGWMGGREEVAEAMVEEEVRAMVEQEEEVVVEGPSYRRRPRDRRRSRDSRRPRRGH